MRGVWEEGGLGDDGAAVGLAIHKQGPLVPPEPTGDDIYVDDVGWSHVYHSEIGNRLDQKLDGVQPDSSLQRHDFSLCSCAKLDDESFGTLDHVIDLRSKHIVQG
ncbi:hypothetical protein BGX29_009896 [Mortierella sp. GBA35]|nr:hypothetical protein BGX29_009896 [Mortierella sp. GBA35]